MRVLGFERHFVKLISMTSDLFNTKKEAFSTVDVRCWHLIRFHKKKKTGWNQVA